MIQNSHHFVTILFTGSLSENTQKMRREDYPLAHIPATDESLLESGARRTPCDPVGRSPAAQPPVLQLFFKQQPDEILLYGKADAQKPVDCLPHQGFSEECKESVSEFIQ